MLFAGKLDLVNRSKPSGFGVFCFISASRDASYQFPVRFISNNPGYASISDVTATFHSSKLFLRPQFLGWRSRNAPTDPK